MYSFRRSIRNTFCPGKIIFFHGLVSDDFLKRSKAKKTAFVKEFVVNYDYSKEKVIRIFLTKQVFSITLLRR